MLKKSNRLWPYGLGPALGAMPAIWILSALVFYLTAHFLSWPAAGAEATLLYFSLAASAIPTALMLLDFIAMRGGKIGSKWLNVDFGKTITEGGLQSRNSLALSDNILAAQDKANDSAGTKLLDTLRRATASEIVYLNLGDGESWWTTRLLTLCAGAQGITSLKAIVFIARVENKERTYVGWATPRDVLTGILNDRTDYRPFFQKAVRIARQLSVFGGPSELLMPQFNLPPPVPPPAGQPIFTTPQSTLYHPQVAASQYSYDDNDSVMLAKITLDLLTPLEGTPDRLTLSRLQQLLTPYLHTDAVDRAWSNRKQLDKFLEATAPYVALTRNGVYEGMLRSELGARAMLRELFRESQKESSESD
ncbi:MAG TPA: hypothetical protein VKG63_07500 [Steroidobacteraceae bacterium]|nr:hypothetical protein [Steroidobacteraceae bacterium]